MLKVFLITGRCTQKFSALGIDHRRMVQPSVQAADLIFLKNLIYAIHAYFLGYPIVLNLELDDQPQS